ncbi:hypothetical protein ABR738_00745 [Streptomyces sp. Edi4]|uniref:hypothetical protein n=1 Tax=Streptomyces sp. Edi4 TaxID=3162527 RepID=UPI003305A971
MTTIALSALDTGQEYDVDTRPGTLGMYEGVVTGPLGSITGDAYALHELGMALIAASGSALFATWLRVDTPGPLNPLEVPVPDPTQLTTGQATAHEAQINVLLVWMGAGHEHLPVEAGDWIGDDDTATALVDDYSDLHFAAGRLHARSRCRYDHIHRTTVEHPDDLAAVCRQAQECTGDEDFTA